MGSGTERNLHVALNELIKYKHYLKKAVDEGKPMLFTGNAMEVMGLPESVLSERKVQDKAFHEPYEHEKWRRIPGRKNHLVVRKECRQAPCPVMEVVIEEGDCRTAFLLKPWASGDFPPEQAELLQMEFQPHISYPNPLECLDDIDRDGEPSRLGYIFTVLPVIQHEIGRAHV